MKIHSTSLLALGGLLCASGGQATTIVGGFQTIAGTTLAASPQLVGTVVADESQAFSIAFGAGSSLSGNVESAVVLASDGFYDFYWRLTGLTGALDQLDAFRLGHLGVTVVGLDAGYLTDGPGSFGPDLALGNPGGTSDTTYLNYLFSSGAGGSDSYFMYLDTNATAYGKVGNFDLVVAGSLTGLFSTFGATASAEGAVPEPASWALMIAGLGMAGAAMRRRQQPKVRFAD